MRSNLSNFNLAFCSKCTTLLFVLATQACLARVLGPEGRGMYAICIVFATTLSLIFIIGCDFEGVYFVSSRRLTISEGIYYSFLFACFGSVLALLAGFIILQQPLSFIAKAPKGSFYLALVSVPTSVLSLVLLNLLTSVNLFGLFAGLFVVYGAAAFFFTAIFVWLMGWGVNGALLANILRDFLIIGLTGFVLRKKCGLCLPTFESSKLKSVMNYAFKYYFGRISGPMNFQVGNILLAILAPTRDVGMFAIASQLVVQILLIPDSLAAILTPKISEESTGKENLIARVSRFTGLITGLILFVLSIIAKSLVVFLFSSQFVEVAGLIQILAFGLFVRCVTKVFIPYLLAVGHPQVVSISAAVGTTANLVCLGFLYSYLGLEAAAIAMVVGYLMSGALLTISFVKVAPIKLSSIWKPEAEDWFYISKTLKAVRRQFSVL